MILDVIILAFFLLFVIIGYKRGAAKTLLSVVCIGAAVFLASAFGSDVSNLIYDGFFKESIVESVNAATAQSGEAVTESAVNGLPDYVYSALSHFGIEKEALLKEADSGVTGLQSTVCSAVEEAVRPVIISIISFFTVIILFLLLMIAFKLLSKLILKLFELPGLNFINRLSGGVLGLAEGVVFVYLLVVLIKLFVPLTGDGLVITPQMIDESLIFKAMYSLCVFSDIEQLCGSVSKLIGL